MNLKDLLTNSGSLPELYWSLVIETGWVQAGIWFIGEKTAQVVSVGPGTAWNSDENLLEAADAALSSAIQKLPENYKEPTKTVFGVASSWVSNGEIKEEFIDKIKKICGELSLTPVGFVVIPEAIAHYYKSEEGCPTNAILLGLGADVLEVSVFSLGNLLGTTQVSRSISLLEDVTEGLSRFENGQELPSRFIVYDGKEGELEEAKEILLQSSWNNLEKIKFLHTPNVEILNADNKVLAVSLAGAAEIGGATRIDAKEETDELVVEENETNSLPIEKPNETIHVAQDLGFAVGSDVSQNTHIENVVPIQKPNFFHSFSSKISTKSKLLPKKFSPNLLGIIGGILILISVMISAWWFLPKADVTVSVTPKRFEQQVSVPFGADIPVEVISDEASGTKTKSTTGVKLIGNKANGNIQIANGNGSAIELSAGTILTSSTGLKFVTNSSASVSGQILPGSPGTANLSVSAYDIGAQYNLAKGEIFSVGNYSKALVAGTSTVDFTGGSSQEIPAVDKTDQQKLEEELKTELAKTIMDNLSTNTTNDKIFLTDLVENTIAVANYNHKIGDSADSLKLDMTIKVKGILVDRSKLIEYAKNILNGNIPAGYALEDDQIDFKFVFLNEKDNKYNYNVTFGANFLPKIEKQKAIDYIAGKSQASVKSYFRQISGFTRAEIKLRPNLPGFLGTLPRVPGNITLILKAMQ